MNYPKVISVIRNSALIVTLCAVCLYGQTGDAPISDGPAPPGTAPGSPNGTYHLSQIESVNLFNGNLNVYIPLVEALGRAGWSFPLGISIDGYPWEVSIANPNGTSFYYPQVAPQSFNGFFNPGYLTVKPGTELMSGCSPGLVVVNITLLRYQFTEANGTTHELRDTMTKGAPVYTGANCSYNGYTPFNRGTQYESSDGSNISFTSDTAIADPLPGATGAIGGSGYLRLRDGTTYRIDNGLVSWIRDRNGNKISVTYPNSGETIVDALGRTISITSTSATYPGVGGASRSVTFQYNSLGNLLRDGGSPLQVRQLFPEVAEYFAAQNTDIFNPTLLSQVTLPDGSAYQFQYNLYGEVAKIILPTGGSYQYDWASAWPGATGGEVGSSSMVYRRVTKRRVYDGTGALREQTSYTVSYPSVPTASLGSTTVTVQHLDPSNNVLSQDVHTFYSAPQNDIVVSGVQYPYWSEGREYQTQWENASGTVLRTDNYAWSPRLTPTSPPAPPLDPQMIEQDVTNDAGQVSKVTFQYDQYNNVTDKKEYDWGLGSAGALLRETQTAFITSSQYVAASINLVSLPSVVAVLDGGGNQASYTIFNYDEYQYRPLQDDPNISVGSHDSSYNTSFSTRGNVTTIWKSQTGSSNVNIIGAQYKVDIAGNVVNQYDGRANLTTIGFNDDNSNQYALPTSIKNALGQTTSFSNDYNIGRQVSATDLNGQTTHYAFNDPLDRVTQIAQPTGAQTNILYANPTWVRVFRDQTTAGDKALENQVVYDGLGRVIEKRMIEGGSTGTLIATDYGYDALGRINSASNPSRITISNWASDGLGYLTVYSYDALGRTISVQAPDGGTTNTSYSGNVTTVTDPAGHARQTTTDGVGRLTLVVEDSTNTNLQTQYKYDALGDLTWVYKCAASGCSSGQTRTFYYDGLARLTQANNPESGTINYTYDANNNLLTRTDARGIQTCYGTLSGSTCNNGYDALNRLTAKTYSDGTPAVTYNWINSTGTGVSNGIGRLSSVSNSAATRNYLAYDPMGRISNSSLSTASNTYNFSYLYDLAGSVLSEKYPSGRVIQTTYDAAERATNVSGTSAAGTQTQYVQPLSTYPEYWPHGALYVYKYNNNIVPVATFDSVLRPSGNWATLNNNGNNWYFILQHQWNQNGTLATTNEGYGPNVLWSNMTWFTLNYGYDALNRLTSAGDSGWSRQFQYDPFGNMSVAYQGNAGVPLNPLTPYNSTGSYNPYNSANNQLLEATYDSAGNTKTLGSAQTFSYDAEERMTQAVVAGTTTNYSYDAEGGRVQKAVSGGATTVYVKDDFGNLASEYSSTGMTPVCTTCYFVYDHLGSVRMITDQNANVIARHDYLPFGEEIPNGWGGRSGNQFGASSDVSQEFTGKERDAESGLDYFGARYLGSALGRFTSPDPIYVEGHRLQDPQLLNLYTYARNNPLALIDPTGMLVTFDCENVNSEQCAQTVTDFNNRDGAQFSVTRDANGQLSIAGNVDPTKLSAGEKALYDAITNTDVTGTLTVVAKDSSFDFEESTGKGKNSIDRSDLNALGDADKRLPGEVLSHAIIESYNSAKKDVSVDDAHGLASTYFGFRYGLFTPNWGRTVTTLDLNWRSVRLKEDYREHSTLVTPIPRATYLQLKAPPDRDITSVELLPKAAY